MGKLRTWFPSYTCPNIRDSHEMVSKEIAVSLMAAHASLSTEDPPSSLATLGIAPFMQSQSQ